MFHWKPLKLTQGWWVIIFQENNYASVLSRLAKSFIIFFVQCWNVNLGGFFLKLWAQPFLNWEPLMNPFEFSKFTDFLWTVLIESDWRILWKLNLFLQKFIFRFSHVDFRNFDFTFIGSCDEFPLFVELDAWWTIGLIEVNDPCLSSINKGIPVFGIQNDGIRLFS